MPDILITGGSDGIGLAVAKLLAARGDGRVTLVARSGAKLREAVDLVHRPLPAAAPDLARCSCERFVYGSAVVPAAERRVLDLQGSKSYRILAAERLVAELE